MTINTPPKIILASASLGRRQLLEKLRVPFEVKPSSIDEDIITHINPYKMLQMRARAKAEDIYQRLASSELASRKENPKRYTLNASYLIIAADSMAVLGNKTYGKAKDQSDAKRILRVLMDLPAQAGKTHTFATATCIIHLRNSSSPPLNLRGGIPSLRLREGQGELRPPERVRRETLTKTLVTLRTLDANSLDAYVSRYDFTRFAAGYALNETPWDLVTKIDGSYTNVIGLPIEVILPLFRKLKLL